MLRNNICDKRTCHKAASPTRAVQFAQLIHSWTYNIKLSRSDKNPADLPDFQKIFLPPLQLRLENTSILRLIFAAQQPMKQATGTRNASPSVPTIVTITCFQQDPIYKKDFQVASSAHWITRGQNRSILSITVSGQRRQNFTTPRRYVNFRKASSQTILPCPPCVNITAFQPEYAPPSKSPAA